MHTTHTHVSIVFLTACGTWAEETLSNCHLGKLWCSIPFSSLSFGYCLLQCFPFLLMNLLSISCIIPHYSIKRTFSLSNSKKNWTKKHLLLRLINTYQNIAKCWLSLYWQLKIYSMTNNNNHLNIHIVAFSAIDLSINRNQ